MFRPLAGVGGERLVMEVDGLPVSVRAGVSLAVALLEAGLLPTRHSPASGAPRAPFCLMGTCYECLVELDGRQVQACAVPTGAGSRVRRL